MLERPPAAWASGALARIADQLGEDLESDRGPQAVEDLLRLIVVLRHRRAAAEAADALVELLRASPGAMRLLFGRTRPAETLDAQRRFLRREGREVVVRAPSASDHRPDEAVRLSILLDPHRVDRARAERAMRRQEANR